MWSTGSAASASCSVAWPRPTSERWTRRAASSSRDFEARLVALHRHRLGMFHRRCEALEAHRLAEQEALQQLAFHLDQVLALGRRLDTFGDHVEAEAVGHRDDCAGEQCGAFARIELAHEAAVDLDRLDRK